MAFRVLGINRHCWSKHIVFFIALAVISLPCIATATHRDTLNVTCKLDAVDDFGSDIHKKYFVTCRGLGLTRVPKELPTTTAELYLDQNNITQVGPFAFRYMPRLRVLDLSWSNIQELATTSFAGLYQLEELYLPFNKIVNVLPGLFASLSQLRILHVQGYGVNGNYSTWSKPIKVLESLEELAISYFSDDVFPSELASLPNLTNLQLSFGSSRNLTSKSLNTLRRSAIQELSFKGNNALTSIEHGAFDEMPELRLLNFACCRSLALDDIIDAISNVSNTRVTHLIVDSTHQDHGDVIYGAADVVECRSVWNHLTHFSIQECGVQFIHASAIRCLANLTALSYGYGTVPIPVPFQEGLKILNDLFETMLPKSNWRSVRTRYLLKPSPLRYRVDWGCFSPYVRRPNADYFPPLTDPMANDVHGQVTSGTFVSYRSASLQGIERNLEASTNVESLDYPQCGEVWFIPRNLRHLEILDVGLPSMKTSVCLNFTANDLIFLNMSTNPALGPDVNLVILGLEKLRVLDISRSGYSKINPAFLGYLPSLTHLYASGNSLQQESFTRLHQLKELEHLDLGSNAMVSLSATTFLGLKKLQTLNIANNRLNSADFLVDLMSFLQSVDLSDNQLRSLDQTVIDAIDSKCSNAHSDCNLEMNLLGNPLSCECDSLHSIRWLRETRSRLTGSAALVCTDQDGKIRLINSIDIPGMGRYCFVISHLPLIASVSATVAIVVLVAAPLAYRFRWHLKWHFYRLKYLGKKHRYTTARTEAHLRDAFVIYSFENEIDRRWVFETLRIKLEQENSYSLWLEGRNDIPGRFRVDNLMDMLRRSHTAIWILSQAFLQDIMCLEMAHQAFIRLGHKKNLVVRRPEMAGGIDVELACRDIGQILEVLHPRYGISVADYASENRHSERLFWKKIGRFFDKTVSRISEENMVQLDYVEQQEMVENFAD